MDQIFASYNITVATLTLFVTLFYINRLVNAATPAANIWFFGTTIITGGLFIYHLYWFFVFATLCCNATILFQKLLFYESYIQYAAGIIIPLGFATHATLFMRELGFDIPLTRVITTFLLFTIFWAGMLHVGFPELNSTLTAPILQNFAVGSHVSLGILSGLITLIYLIAYSRASNSEVKNLTLGFAYISSGFTLYQIHWATHVFYLGFYNERPYRWLLEQWWYLGILAFLLVVGNSILMSECSRNYGWKRFNILVVLCLSILMFGISFLGLSLLKQ